MSGVWSSAGPGRRRSCPRADWCSSSRSTREAQFAGVSFYEYYVGERITGFMSHWMTFGGQLMIVLSAAGGVPLLLALRPRETALVRPAVRGAGGASPSSWASPEASGWRPARPSCTWCGAGGKLPVAGPARSAGGRDLAGARACATAWSRCSSHTKEMDSNQHRIVCWRTGWQMIKAHPWFGLGPEQVRVQFDNYVPPDIPRPLAHGLVRASA